MIQIKRAYEAAAKADGARILVERLWPRGIRKADLPLAGWAKDIAPSAPLRRWYSHDVAKWPEFQRRYTAELRGHAAALAPLLTAARAGTLTLVYGAHDTEHNSAAVLKAFLETRLAHKGGYAA